MKITPSKKLPRLAEHLAYCHSAAEQGRYDELSECLVVALGPILSLINEDFESLEADFLALKAQIDQANADVEHFFTVCDERQR